MRFLFKKKYRLLKKNCFCKVIKSQNQKQGRFLRIYFRYNLSKHPKIGITASSYFGNAIKRNRFKRHIREIFRKNISDINPSLEIVVYPRKDAKNALYKDIEEEFLGLLDKI